MNKIYKVVWNAARNCYVVGSEFISKTRRGEGYRSNVTTAGARTLLAVCAACGISFYSGGLAVAADNLQTEPTIVIEVQEQKNEAVQPELLYSQLAAASAGADALDITMPADVPAAAEDTSEAPAVDVSSQHSIHDENGYYVYNGTKNDTYNSLTKDGLWVGGVDDKTGFHVDNTGHASANGLDVQNQKITGVADGEFNADSTDAVTAGQLYDAGIVPGKAADGSVAIGNGSTVTSGAWDWDTNTPLPANGVAIGDNAKVNNSAVNGVVIGQGAEVRTDNATAIGQGSRVVSGDGSVALGQGSMVTAADAKGTDAHGVVSVGLTGNKVTEGFTRRIINVADGVNDSDAATVGQISKITGMDSEKGNVVQYDGEDKSTITFAGTNGTALNNVNDIVMNVKNPINKKTEQHSFQNAGLLPGKVEGTATSGKWNMAIGEGSEIAVDGGTGANMKFNTAIGNSAGVSQAIVDDGYEDVERSTAIGHAAKVRANNSTAIGDSSNVSKDNSVAVGQKAEVQSATSIAIGQGTKIGSNAENSIAIGTSANQYSVGSKAKNSTVVGVNAWSMAEGGTVLGKSAKIQGSAANGTAIGTNATINVSAGSGNVALGADSTVSKADVGDDTEHGVVSVGQSGDKGFNRRIINVADGVNDSDAATVKQVKAVRGDVDELNKLAVTYTDNTKKAVNFNGATLKNVGDIQIGNAQSTFVGSGLVNGKVYDTDAGQWAENGANATHSMAVGSKSNVRGTDSVAVGPEATVNNGNSVVLEQSTAVGSKATVTSSFSTALGANTQAKGGYSVAVGAQSQTTGANATAIGAYAAAGENSVVVGGGEGLAAPTVSKANSTAMGTYVDIKSDNGTALGYGSQIGWNGKNSVALGADSVANEENVVSVGHTKGQANGFGETYREDLNRRITNVADGVNDNDAATVGQIKTMTGVDAELGGVVQYDDASKNSVTFQSTDKAGTTLNNVNDITMNVEKYLSGTSIVQGYKTVSFKDAGIIPGTFNGTANKDTIVLGRDSTASKDHSVVIGGGARAIASNTVSIGTGASADANNSMAIGSGSKVIGAAAVNGTAIGTGSWVTDKDGTALGYQAYAWGEAATVIGDQSRSWADGGTTLGQNARIQTGADNSVALGKDSYVSKDDILASDTNGVVSVGVSALATDDKGTGVSKTAITRRIINVADGINDSDAATFGQVKDVQDSVKALDASAVQYDSVSKSTVTFDGTNGTALKNVSDIVMNTKDFYGKDAQFSFQDAGLLPGDVQSLGNKWNMAIGEGSAVKVEEGTGSKMQMNTVVGNKARITQALVDDEYQDVEKSTALGQGVTVAASNAVGVGQGSNVRGEGGVAVGMQANVSAKSGVAVGKQSKVSSDYSIAIGGSASVGSKSENSVAMGYEASSLAAGGTAIGQGAKVQGSAANGTAIGKGAIVNVNAGNSVALGASSQVQTADIGSDTEYGVVSVGKSGTNGFTRRIVNVADGLNDSDAATVGQLNAMQSAYTDSGIVGGTMDKNTLATGAVAIGKDSNVHGTGSIAIGTGSKVEKYNSVAIGRNAIVKGAGSVALGASSVATEDNVLSLGRNDGSLGLRIVNMKDGINERDAVTVGQMNELAFGTRSSSLPLANGATNLAAGINKNTAAINSLDEQLDNAKVDWGESTQSMKELTEKASAFAAQTQNVDWNALNSVDWNAVSAMAAVPATMNLAIDDAQANEGDTGAEKDDDNRSPQTNGSNPGKVDGNLHVSGNTTLDGTLNVKGDATFEGNATFDKGATMKGDLNMSGNKITGLGAGDVSADSTDAVNGSQLFDVQQQVSDNRNAIGALGSRVSDLGEEVDSVGAISAALAGLHPLDYNGTGSKFQISAALGTYDGTQAAAIGGFYHFNRDTLLSIGGSTSFEGDRKTAANVGVTFRVGEGASEAPAVQDTETKQQMDAMKQEIEMLKAELEQLKNKDTEGTNAKN